VREGLSAARILLQYGLGWVDAHDVATRSVRDLSGYSETRMRAECRQWYGEVVRRHVSDKARDEVKRCRDAGYEVAILTGQTNYAA